MPLDLTPVPEGNVIIRMGPGLGQQTAIVETTTESETRRAQTIAAARLAFVPHWATCPTAAAHRRAKENS
jgi:hypothetical protein